MFLLVLLLGSGSGMVTCSEFYYHNDNSAPQYSDTCEYSSDRFFYKCGEQCTYSFCKCGNTSIVFWREAKQCCVPAEASQGRSGAEGVVTEDTQCSGGEYW